VRGFRACGPLDVDHEVSERSARRSGGPRHLRAAAIPVEKIQEVYGSQSVATNDKHIEVICRQMLRSVRVTRVGDSDFLSYQAMREQVDRFRFMEENEKVMDRGGGRAGGRKSVSLSWGHIWKLNFRTRSLCSRVNVQIRPQP
jgi:hypothetical protein